MGVDMSVRRNAESVGKSLVVWASMLITSFALVIAVKHVFAKELKEPSKRSVKYTKSVPKFREHSIYQVKDDYGWTHYYIYLNGDWLEFRRVSANGARVYDWCIRSGQWVRVPSHLSKPATGWYARQNWSAPPKYPSTTHRGTTPATTSY